MENAPPQRASFPRRRSPAAGWPTRSGAELIFRNDWAAPLRMRLRATDTALTVRFYSARFGRRVETTTGEPFDFMQPSTVVVLSPALAPGAEVVVQEAGEPGFTVEYTRRVYRARKLVRHERFRTEYEPRNAIIEVGPRLLGRP